MGGQAVLEGVMMRGASSWAVAVRDPEGEIQVVVHDVPSGATVAGVPARVIGGSGVR